MSEFVTYQRLDGKWEAILLTPGENKIFVGNTQQDAVSQLIKHVKNERIPTPISRNGKH